MKNELSNTRLFANNSLSSKLNMIYVPVSTIYAATLYFFKLTDFNLYIISCFQSHNPIDFKI